MFYLSSRIFHPNIANSSKIGDKSNNLLCQNALFDSQVWKTCILLLPSARNIRGNDTQTKANLCRKICKVMVWQVMNCTNEQLTSHSLQAPLISYAVAILEKTVLLKCIFLSNLSCFMIICCLCGFPEMIFLS